MSTNSDPVISIRSLTRYYGKKCVVNQLNLEIPRGVVFGLLGRNGAGKTTTIRMLLGLAEPTRGSATVLGQDCRALSPETRARIGYLAEGHHVYGWMTVRQCGEFQKAFHPKWNDDLFYKIVAHFRLDPAAKAGSLSRGQRAGLCLALTLAPEPELLVLDDPALGLDPVARRSLLESMIFVTRGAGRTILFSSHLLSDVERVADRIAVMDRGVLKAECTLDEFRGHVRQFVMKFPGVPPPLTGLPGLLHSFRSEGQVTASFANSNGIEEKLRAITPDVEETPLGLEDAFIAYVGERGEKSFFLDKEESK